MSSCARLRSTRNYKIRSVTQNRKMLCRRILLARARLVSLISTATIVNGKSCVLYLWYDNEFGYCCQVGRMVYKMAGVTYQHYPLKG